MSIPIPIILALLAQKNSKTTPQKQISGAKSSSLVPVVQKQRPQVNRTRTRNNQNMVSKLTGVAQLIGGQRGAKIGNVAKVMNTVNSINGPANALSLFAKNTGASPISSMFSNPSTQNAKGASNIYGNISNMLSGMDKGKKDELLSMAQSLMNPNKP